MAHVPAWNCESYRAKAEVAARFLRDTTALGFIASIFHKSDDAELALVASFLDDALRLAEA